MTKKQYDLQERTARFGEVAIQVASGLKVTPVTAPLLKQLVRSATSVGANYAEADEAATKPEFRYKISLCKREAKETAHWLRMLRVAAPDANERMQPLTQEAKELCLIFAAIYRNAQPPTR